MFSPVRRFVLRLAHSLRANARDGDLSREIDAHLAFMQDDFERRGMSPEEARRAARVEFGGVGAVTAEHRDARSFRWLVDGKQDVRYGIRVLRRAPGFSAVAVLSLALGIGANTVLFSVLDTFIFRSLPVPSPDRLVNLKEVQPGGRERTEVPHREFVAMRDGLADVMSIAAVAVFDRSNVRVSLGAGGTGDDNGRARVGVVSGNYFPTLQVPTAVGRSLTPDDDRMPGGHAVAVISDGFWRRRFNRAADILQHTVTIHRTTFAIIGVTPDGFTGDWIGRPVDVWVPTMMQASVMVEAPEALTARNAYWLRLVGRLADSFSREAAADRARIVYERLMHEAAASALSPAARAAIIEQRIALEPGRAGFSPQRDSLRGPITTLSAIAVIVLLVVCANVAGLMLSRSMARRRELAVRLAIGAGGTRLARQLLAESLVLAVLGGGIGVALAIWGTRALAMALATAPIQMFWASTSWISFDVELSLRGLIFSALASVLTGLVIGVAPAARGRRIPLAPALTARSAIGDGESRLPLGRILIAAQVGLSLAVFVTAALLFWSFVNLRAYNLGFDRENLLLVWTQPSATGRTGEELKSLWRDVQRRLLALPGVIAASGANGGVLTGSIPVAAPAGERLLVDGQPPRMTTIPGGRTFVMPGYFQALGVPFAAGEDFAEADLTRPVVILNETLARFYFPNENPIGRLVGFGSPTRYRIVGVVGEFERGTPRAAGRPHMATYFPYSDSSGSQLVVLCAVVRTHGDPKTLTPRIRDELRAIDPALAVLRIDTVDEQLNDVLAQDRLLALLAAFFGGMGVLLSCLGLYGLVAHMTSRRTPEIAVRVALGATRRDVLWMVLGDGLRTVMLGVGAGIPAAIAAGRLIAPQLFEVRAGDPLIIGLAALTMAAVAAAAALIPARRAAAIDPIAALRDS